MFFPNVSEKLVLNDIYLCDVCIFETNKKHTIYKHCDLCSLFPQLNVFQDSPYDWKKLLHLLHIFLQYLKKLVPHRSRELVSPVCGILSDTIWLYWSKIWLGWSPICLYLSPVLVFSNRTELYRLSPWMVSLGHKYFSGCSQLTWFLHNVTKFSSI